MLPEDQQIIRSWLDLKSAQSQSAYTTDLRQFFNFHRQPIAQISLRILQDYQLSLVAQKLKPASINRKLNCIKSLLSFCVSQQYLAINPGAAIKIKPNEMQIAQKVITREEVAQLIQYAANERDRVFLLTLYTMALRVSECCGLKWIDFTQQENTGRMQAMVLGKGNKLAPVICPEATWEALSSIRQRDSDYVFPFDRQTAHDIIKRAVDRAKLNPEISCHWLRHSAGTHALNAGAPLSLVRDWLRHSNIQTTDRYLHSFPGQSGADYLSFDAPLSLAGEVEPEPGSVDYLNLGNI
jgi:integrase/recombinase XerD